MNINPISFGKVIRVVGNEPKKAAKEIRKFINNDANGVALSVSFSNDCTYIATGKDAEKLYELRKDKTHAINAAKEAYGKNSSMVELVKTAENDRYNDLAKCILSEADVVSIDTTYDNEDGQLKSIYILG